LRAQFSFNVDFKDWQQTLSTQEHTILTHLIQGYKAKDIAEILHTTYQAVRTSSAIKTIVPGVFSSENSLILDRIAVEDNLT